VKPRHALGSNSVTVVGIKGKKFGDRRGGKQIKHEVRKEERDAWRRSLFVQMPNNPGCGKQNKARICQRSIFKLRTCLVFFAVRKEEKGQVLGGRPASGKKKADTSDTRKADSRQIMHQKHHWRRGVLHAF